VAGDLLDDDARCAARTYGAAADHFVGPALGVSDRSGEQTVARLSLAPGEALAISNWGPGLFEPASSLFWSTVRDVRPALYKVFNPWDEITTPHALVDLFARGEVRSVTAEAQTGSHVLEHPGRF
jgi:hypothetical protein